MISCAAYFLTLGVVSWENEKGYVAPGVNDVYFQTLCWWYSKDLHTIWFILTKYIYS